jgi:hypothetical protein
LEGFGVDPRNIDDPFVLVTLGIAAVVIGLGVARPWGKRVQ